MPASLAAPPEESLPSSKGFTAASVITSPRESLRICLETT